MTEAEDEQLALVPAPGRRARAASPAEIAAVDPVAEVAVDVPLPHLDRRFEYAVPAAMADDAQPGVRVRVRFAGQDVEGYLLARRAEASHPGRLAPLRTVVSAEPVLSAELLGLCRAVADRWGGVLPDVLRLAVPRRHATTERRDPPEPATAPERPPSGRWDAYRAGPAFLDHVAAGGAPRAVWTALPGEDWPAVVATAVGTALAAGRGALVVVPDHRDVERVDAALTALLGKGRHVRLTADQGASARYRAWLLLRRGCVRAVVGTRAAAFAPVADLGLTVVWDDGDDLHAEPHAPYPHVREVLALRGEREHAAVLVGSTTRTAEAQAWLTAGTARSVEAPREEVRAAAPRVLLPGEGHEPERDPAASSARLPTVAWRTAQQGLAHGPVLVQVPRRGYRLSLRCDRCRAPARCGTCAGPLGQTSGHAVPACTWCGRPAADWRCPHCAGTRLRAAVLGQRRTAEELGRAFPGVPVRRSGAGEVLASVPDEPALVVATPGAEPVADGGYAAALLLDGWALLDRADLRAGEEALRRWVNAAALVRPGSRGGTVVLLAPAGLPPVEALVRWDPGWHAARELEERTSLSFPPAVALATLTGPAEAVTSLLRHAQLPASAEVLGPVPVEVRGPAARAARGGGDGDEPPPVRTLVRVPTPERTALARALHDAAAVRSARKEPGAVRVQVDPLDVL